MPFADINGINLYYEIQGFGDPVLLLHHGFGCTKMWDKLVPRLVEQGYKTICYDRRGFGQSEPGKAFHEFYVSDDFRQRRSVNSTHSEIGSELIHFISSVNAKAACWQLIMRPNTLACEKRHYIKYDVLQHCSSI